MRKWCKLPVSFWVRPSLGEPCAQSAAPIPATAPDRVRSAPDRASPRIVDTWYDDGLSRAFAGRDHGRVQGVSRNGEWIDIFTRAYNAAGAEVPEADPAWKTLIYKPHGTAGGTSSYLMSDSDYMEVLTEIDIQRPIPAEVQRRRTGRPFLFIGCRFDDQMLRIFARQIAKRSAAGHIAVMPEAPTRMEGRFFADFGVTRIDAPVAAVADILSVPEG